METLGTGKKANKPRDEVIRFARTSARAAGAVQLPLISANIRTTRFSHFSSPSFLSTWKPKPTLQPQKGNEHDWPASHVENEKGNATVGTLVPLAPNGATSVTMRLGAEKLAIPIIYHHILRRPLPYMMMLRILQRIQMPVDLSGD